jgi:hypothetical protein
MNRKTANNKAAVHRVSRSKRWGAPQRCPIYATIILSSNFRRIIPFTLKHVHNRLKGYADYEKRVKYRVIPFVW